MVADFSGSEPIGEKSAYSPHLKWVDIYHKSAHFMVYGIFQEFSFLVRNFVIIQEYLLFGNFSSFSYRLKKRSKRKPLDPPPNLPEDGKIYAFYLPQFHQIPENDLWWGKGFTEWVNVKKAKPLFKRHYQPRLPNGDFYDLSEIEVMKEQAALAKLFGVDAFVVYFYWFDGKRLLEKPLDNILANPDVAFPFVLCWANENWTRRWDGQDHEVLMEQTYIDNWLNNFYQDIGIYLRNSNYQRLDGKIILLIYRPDLIPNFVEFSKILKAKVKEDLSLDLLLSAPNFILSRVPSTFIENLDFLYEFQINYEPKRLNGISRNGSFVRSLTDYLKEEPEISKKVYPGVFTSWDNTARRGKDARIIHPSNPAVFREWLYRRLVQDMKVVHPTSSITFVNAWNEWAEGAHLEPDKRFGYQWLWGVHDAKMKFSKLWGDRDAINGN